MKSWTTIPFLCALSIAVHAKGPVCADILRGLETTAANVVHIRQIKEQYPAVYRGIVEAVGEAEAANILVNWRPKDLAPMMEKIEDFRKHLIEFLRDPQQSKFGPIPREYFLRTFGELGEIFAIAEFRKTQPAWVQVEGDTSKGSASSGSRNRPDGLAYYVFPASRKITVFSIMESKVGKKTSFSKKQYADMLQQWRTLGLEVGDRNFTPDQIDFFIDGRRKSLSDLTEDEFFSMLYVYRPGLNNLSAPEKQQLAINGIHNILPTGMEPQKMRYIGTSILIESLQPYISPILLRSYRKELQQLVSLYRQHGGILGATPGKVPAEVQALMTQLLQHHDPDVILAVVGALAPDLVAVVKDD